MSDLGCAQSSDGKLLDASEIDWFHDCDDPNPIAPSSTGATVGSSLPTSREPSASTLDKFFANASPVRKIAGACRSARVPRPSTRVNHPDNAMASASSRKRRDDSSGSTDAPRVLQRRRKLPDSDEDPASSEVETTELDESDTEVNQKNVTDTDGDSGEDLGDDDGDDGEAAYQQTKAFGDTDRRVSTTFAFIFS
jgi:hypothetical protein